MSKSLKNKWSKSELKKLRQSLPDGWAGVLADKHNLSPGTITNVIYGSQVNDQVVLSAIELAEEHKRLIASKKEAISAL